MRIRRTLAPWLLAGVGLWLAVDNGPALVDEWRLRGTAETGTARVISVAGGRPVRFVRRVWDDLFWGRGRRVDYELAGANGVAREATFVTHSVADTLRPGGTVDVRYLSTDRSVHRITGEPGLPLLLFRLLIALCVAGLSATWLVRSRHGARLLAFVLVLASPALAGAQDRGLFQIPPSRSPREVIPAGCEQTRERATAILAEVEREIPASAQQKIRAAAADREPGESAADGWDHAASLLTLNSDPTSALWAELQALRLEWRAEFVADAGIFLTLLKHDQDAGLFLRCAYDAGLRSAYLFEALANLYRRTGDTARMRESIASARALAPADPLIEAEFAIFTTGSPPPPRRTPADPIDRAMAALDLHRERVVAATQAAVDLQIQVDDAIGAGTPETRRQMREGVDASRQAWAQSIDAIRTLLPSAKMTIAEARRQYPGVADSGLNEIRQAARNSAFHSIITLYLSLTNQLLTQTASATIWENWDVDYWGETLGFEPIELARMMGQLSRFEVEGTRSTNLGNSIADLTMIEFDVLYQHSISVRIERHGECTRLRGDPAEACRLEVNRQWCATVRPLFLDWVTRTEGWFQRAALRFDRVAAGRIAWGGWQVDDAWEFIATYAREIKTRPGADAGMLQEINDKYRELVDLVTGSRDVGNQGPAFQARYSAETYRLDKSTFEQHQASIAEDIQDFCQDVDRKVMEQLADEYQKALQSMLLERLIRDFNAEYDAKPNCSFSAGPWFSASIDDTGKIGVSGKWKMLDRSFSDDQAVDSVEVGRKYKVDFRDGEFVGASVGLEGSAKSGPFTGKGGLTLGTTWNSQTQQWDPSVEFSGTLGFGFKATDKSGNSFGVVCYPGSVKVKFDPRVVAADAVAYWHSLN